MLLNAGASVHVVDASGTLIKDQESYIMKSMVECPVNFSIGYFFLSTVLICIIILNVHYHHRCMITITLTFDDNNKSDD